ncbi:hypothetical protein CRYUN_Cryun04dG0029700 [Craigia yunnanensis]
MEIFEVVIVGAGIAGLTTSLGLHRFGIPSLVLESSDRLRISGFALTTWDNAWKALDAVGIGHSLRKQHKDLHRLVVTSTVLKQQTSELSFRGHEIRCVRRSLLLEALVLIGCDGVNSVVAKWLGFEKPAFTGRSAFRGYADFKSGHAFKPEFRQFVGKGIRSGFLPCDDHIVYWFLAWFPSSPEEELEENPVKLKQFVLNKLDDTPDEMKSVIENTPPDGFVSSSPLIYRHPWDLLWGYISKGNVCIAGDALHPMTPDIGQGGCAALEDGVVLSRCLAEALLKSGREIKDKAFEEEDYKCIELTLNKYANERRWRSFDLVSTSYMVGFIQQNNGKIISFIRDKLLSTFLSSLLLAKADFDCGKLNVS